ncbi:MAG: DUF2945 domain-containing protein [Candidatus Velthaea sp.]
MAHRAKDSQHPLKKGAHVAWQSAQGTIRGTVERKVTKPAAIKGHDVQASPENPEYIVRSDKTGAEAAHKPAALKRVK